MATSNRNMTERHFPSADGKHEIYATVWAPKGAPRAVVQIAHGMIDYIGRYEGLAAALNAAGILVAGNDHLGHGRSAANAEDFGFFAPKDGVDFVLRDLKTMNELLHNEYPGVPVILLGHSMGSFLARLYTARYPDSVRGLIIHGTGGPNPLLPCGKALAAVIRLFAGERYRSKTVADMAFTGYNSHFDPSEGQNAWLTRDGQMVASRGDDPYTNFIFTVAGYQDLFRMVGGCNAKAWFAAFPKELPTLVVSGTEDPVGDYGKGPTYVYQHLLIAGATGVSLKLYEGARHELFNETNREEVFADLIAFVQNAVG